jgi:hypothetical protein
VCGVLYASFSATIPWTDFPSDALDADDDNDDVDEPPW